MWHFKAKGPGVAQGRASASACAPGMKVAVESWEHTWPHAGGLSFWQLSLHSTHTPVSIRKLTWGDQQPSMWLRTRPLTFQLNHKVWQNLTADMTCAQKGKIEEIFTVIMHLKYPWFSVLTMFICVLSSPPTLPIHHWTWHHLRKPMRKEENGTSRAEYAMTSSQNNKTVDNSAVV